MTIAPSFRRSARATALAAGLALAGALPAAAVGVAGSGRVAGSAAEGAPVMRLDSVVQAAIGDGASPGAAVAIGHSSGDVVIRTYGRTDWSRSAPAVTDSTLYDLASLTKVLAATPAAMLLVQRGRLDLDAPISRYLWYWPSTGDKGRITARDLLLHTAGFPAGEKLRGADRDARLRDLASRPLAYVPGTRTVYSDISMVVLAALVERITGERLDRFVTRNLYMPLEMRDTRFTPLKPLDADPFALDRIAPTEGVGEGQIHGYAQDPMARQLDGISGNAGLFSSIRDVARFAQLMLVGAEGMHTPVLADTTIQLFTRRAPGAARYLGWDAPTGALFGPYFSDASFGHTGYTGTSIWVDPARDVFVVLLTNRVDPTAANHKHMALRRAVNALVTEDFSAGALPARTGLVALAASLLKDLPFHTDADPAADASSDRPAWFGPEEYSVATTHAGAALTLTLLLLLSPVIALAERALARRARRRDR